MSTIQSIVHEIALILKRASKHRYIENGAHESKKQLRVVEVKAVCNPGFQRDAYGFRRNQFPASYPPNNEASGGQLNGLQVHIAGVVATCG